MTKAAGIARDRYGYKWGPLFWRANVTVAARMFGDAGWELRWIGVAIPFTNWGIGFLWRVRKFVVPPGEWTPAMVDMFNRATPESLSARPAKRKGKP